MTVHQPYALSCAVGGDGAAPRVSLTAGQWTAEILPQAGGAIGRLLFAGLDVLRPAPPGPDLVAEQTSCFPLVPYANRIAHGRFGFDDAVVVLPCEETEPNSLHGLGWRRPWTLVTSEPAHARLEHAHDGGAGWPWAYQATQDILLDDDGLTLRLAVTNRDARPMPAGLGLHPYFPVTAQTRLQAVTRDMWLAKDNLPTKPAPAQALGDWRAGAGVSGQGLINNAYDGWDGRAWITQPDVRIQIICRGARALQLYHPPGEGFVCVEPVSHLPDAFNRPDFAFDVLAPDQTLSLNLEIGASLRS